MGQNSTDVDTEATARIEAASAAAVKHLQAHRLQIISERAQNIVSRAIGSVSASGHSSSDLVDAVEGISRRVDAAAAYKKVEADVDHAINAASYPLVLRLVRHKGLLPLVARAMKLHVDEYRRVVLKLLRETTLPQPSARIAPGAAPIKAETAYTAIRSALQL